MHCPMLFWCQQHDVADMVVTIIVNAVNAHAQIWPVTYQVNERVYGKLTRNAASAVPQVHLGTWVSAAEIGRASCRERVLFEV